MRRRGMNFMEIGKRLGVSKQRASQLVNARRREAPFELPDAPEPYVIDAAGMWLRMWKRTRLPMWHGRQSVNQGTHAG
jgi:hypothetical protein